MMKMLKPLRRSPRSRAEGFTLLEVLVALLIFSISVAALVRGMTQIVKQTEQLELKTFAAWIADNEYTELAIAENFPAVGEKKKTIEYASRTWRVVEKVIATPNPQMRKVEIQVLIADTANLSERQVISVTSFIGNNS
ncbi:MULTISPECIES: type II secretion system minor pseudopilin GspI [unclassified Hahella]|uniref:type II secretion system minor pseudopilin GspI n=1 Tax=unclassified Hahella TaxID=2624107 RepID=UPI001C1E9603|nr:MULTISPECIES: type II secretion system minor pseudopilin GspI [unclassified Hahella]MBU6953208.1 type II secretion system minor pseudopilin GspI [Hahella sp. HN01]MDG9671018.1 type II secretion system minor pseudopilin GspI [Hahella sp. CR1]